MTVQPKAHEKARDSRARALFDGIDDSVFVHDLDGRILDANPAACRRLGYSREEMLGLTTRDIDDPVFAAGFGDRLKQQFREGKYLCEGRHVTKDGRVFPVEISTSVIDMDGKPAVLAVIRDITNRKKTERRQESLYAVTRILAEATVLNDAAPRILKAIGEGFDWNFGAMWLADKSANELQCVDCWHDSLTDAVEFERATRSSRFAPGVGLPGRTWLHGRPFWVADVAADGNFPRAPFAAQANFHGGLAFPIQVGGDTLGAVEFFLHTFDKPDDHLLSMLASLGSQIGQFIERVRFEEALQESEGFYHSLVETLPQNIIRKDREGRITFANQRCCATMGKKLEDVVGKTDFELFPEELARKYRADDLQVLRTGKNLEAIEEHQTSAGEKLYVQIMKTPICDSENEMIGTQVIFWDVTERKRWEEALSDSERRYRQLTEASLDGIVVADETGTITLFNPAAERIFGYSSAEVLGQSLDIIVPSDYLQAHRQGLQRYVETRQPHLIGRPTEMSARRRDGTEFTLELSLSAIDLGGELQFLGSIRDTTERTRMRSALVQSEKLASIGLLSAGVAHEINNPLAYVANNLVVLDRDVKGLMSLLDLYEKAKERVAEIDPTIGRDVQALADEIDLPYVRENFSRVLTRTRDGVQRVARIVHNLRGLARTDRPQMEDVALTDLVEMSLELVRGRLQRQGITLEQDHHISRLRCVPTQIGQVILNLLVNALQAIEAKEKADGGRIRIASRSHNDEVLIEISDTGCGIDPQDLTRLFDPFFTTKPVGEGTGLGLSITHGIITGHGGRIEVSSVPGEGSCFKIYLPK
ncbi:MAG TPA: PAS domain S-box protein [Gemmataceae bacterium]|nr:PAS domain S-box protein [Gemmataceae bacterium]